MNSPGISSLIAATLGLQAHRRQTEFEEHKLSTERQLALEEKIEDLARANKQLLEEIARHQESQRLLRESEQQYRFVFTESPQPQWIFDLRSRRLLTVNSAALGLFEFTREEFLALSASRLLCPEAIPLFLRDVAIPCPKAQSRGHWPLCKKDGSRIAVEISAIDLNYDGCPARLIVAIPVTAPGHPEPEQPQARELETITEAAGKVSAMDSTVQVFDDPPKLSVPKSADSTSISQPQTIASAGIPSSGPTRQLVSLDDRNSTKTEPVKTVAPAPRLTVPSSPAGKDPVRAGVSPVTQKQLPVRRNAPGRETILLVEPEGKVRGLARFILNQQGYRVIETDCSSTVMALWESESTSIDLLLTDVALPEGISGSALADQLRQTKPELKVLYTSGDVAGNEGENVPAGKEIVPKPYTADKLLQAIRNCLV
jgi:CheY-like chemotaxis protein